MSSNQKTLIKLFVVLLLSGSALFLPDMLNTPEETLINPIQARVVALFIFAALMWILEVIPIWTTSVAVIALTLFATSNQSLNFLKEKRFEMKEVYSVIENVVTPEACPTAVKKFVEAPDPETPGAKILESPLAQIKADVKTKLTKKGQLTNDDLYMTVSSSYMNYADKCAKAASKLEKKENKTEADNQLMADYKAAADELYGASNGFNTSENRKALKDVKIVNLTQQKSIFATFADPIILLFLGGFFLADAATKYRLDVNLARVLLKPFGTNPKYVLLGLMTVTAVFSMFMSNTATAAMMLALLTPVLALFKPEDRGRAAFALCIPVGANVGGIGTPSARLPTLLPLSSCRTSVWMFPSVSGWLSVFPLLWSCFL